MRRTRKRRSSNANYHSESNDSQHATTKVFYFEELEEDLEEAILERIKIGMYKEPLPVDIAPHEIDAFIDQQAREYVELSDSRRTLSQWLRFAERGQ